MKSVFDYLITIFAVFYWIFRVAVCLMYSLKQDFICQPVNQSIEILILFLTIPSIIFIIRRNTVAATLYFGMYVAYFGTIVYDILVEQTMNLESSTDLLFSSLGVIIPLLVFCDVFFTRNRTHLADKKTDWYYENDKYDREFDERADRNQYKIK